MCGIAGLLIGKSAQSPDQLKRLATGMSDSLSHRGPDDDGVWVDADAGIALSQRRLSIVDLSPAGHQPMISSNGRFVISYNGEVYNHEDIRPELTARGVAFRGHSDTEVMLEAFAVFGVEATVKRLIGMFAIAVWDRQERELTLVRDRLGIKPLYWGQLGDTFAFGSELKALRAIPGWTPRVDRSAVASFMRHNYVPAPSTIYEGVRKLEPGTILTLKWNQKPVLAKFWNARSVAISGMQNRFDASDAELTDRLETLLGDAVRRRMVADVPVGAFLSGGIDSSTVVALMQAANAGKVRTFTIGFDIPGYNEAQHAAAVAKHLKTEHTEMTVTAQDALDVIPRLPEFYDEPFADSSQIPTYLVSALTRKHVTVALSGDGGDELFAGYNRYQLATRFWRSLTLLPAPIRSGIASALTALSPDRWTRMGSIIPGALRTNQIGDKVHKVAALLALRDPGELYLKLVSHWNPDEIILMADEVKGILQDNSVAADFPDLLERMQYLDLVTYLPDDILTKVDRASMAVALEARVPLIDHRVVEFAWQLPRSVCLRNGASKWILRQVLYRHVPPELVERPKMGFGIPLGEWIRGPLRDWAENLLGEQRLREAGLLDPTLVRRYWSEHLSGTRNWQYLLWDVLMLEAWRERWMKSV